MQAIGSPVSWGARFAWVLLGPFARRRIESDVKGNGKYKAQLSALRLRERKTVLKRCQTGIGEIDRALNARKTVHSTSSSYETYEQ